MSAQNGVFGALSDFPRRSHQTAPPMIPMKKSKLTVSEYFVFGEIPAWLKIFHI
jgi:hypothetical protein